MIDDTIGCNIDSVRPTKQQTDLHDAAESGQEIVARNKQQLSA